ncbi:MAG TPA: hypothetical protein VFY75_00080 [Solirubrobacterales bacterium]|nr:hypothetical protein [Solirubrobacterales bacterium]
MSAIWGAWGERRGGTRSWTPPVAFLAVALLLLLPFCSPARAGTAEELTGLQLRDALSRTESPLANGMWSALKWSEGSVSTGRVTTAGWGPSAAFPTVNGAYWSTAPLGNYGVGSAAAITLQVSPGNAERYVSIWLDMPDPANVRSGNELRLTVNPDQTYAVTLAKWSSGSSTVLASNPSVAIPAGSTLAITHKGGALEAWKGTAGNLTSFLSASDFTHTIGYAGLEGSGNITRALNFRAASLLGGKIEGVPVLDNLERDEIPLAGGNWSRSDWAGEIGGVWNSGGYHGYGSNTATKITGAYWNQSTFGEEGRGDVVSAIVGSSASWEGEYLALWLNMPDPGKSRSGYEVRLSGASGGYLLQLSKWASGTRTILASASQVSIPVGSTVALTALGGGLTVWTGTSTLSPVIWATDSTYASGRAGLEVYGVGGTLYRFRTGLLPPAPPTLSGATPSSGDDNTPLIKGSAPPFATVKLYSNSGCTGTPLATGSAATLASPGIEVNVADNSSTSVYGTAGLGSSTSLCSSTSVAYKENTPRTTALEALTSIDPLNRFESPLSNEGRWLPLPWITAATTKTGQDTTNGWGPVDAFPTTHGAYWSSTTFNETDVGNAAALTMQASPGLAERFISLWLNMPNPASAQSGYRLTWTQTATANVYSVALVKVSGGTSTVLASSPSVSIPQGTTLVLADTGGVVEALKGSGGSYSSLLSAADATYAGGYAGIEAAGNYSRSVNFRAGSLHPLPDKPTVIAVSPAAGNNNSPLVRGNAEADTTVKIYSNAGCTGTPLATGSAATFAWPGIPVSVADNTTTTFRASATNPYATSACSTTSATYTEDSTAPAAPSLSSTSPVSPANNNAPKLVGSAEGGATVKLYSNAGCTGTPLATGSAATFAAPGIPVSVADNTATSIRATATDAYGNVSACGAPIAYREDSTAPTAGLDSSFDPANPTDYSLQVQAGDAGTGSGGVKRVEILLNGDPVHEQVEPCVGGQCPASVAVPWSHHFDSPLDGSKRLQVVVRDAAGNVAGTPSFPIPSKVIRATVYDGDPAAGGTQLAQEWAQPDLRISRRDTSSERSTRSIEACPEAPESFCAVQRKLRLVPGDPDEEDPFAGNATEVSVPLAEAASLADAASLLTPTQPGFGSTVQSGQLSSVLQAWQTPPAGAGTTYDLVRSSHPAEEGLPSGSWEFWLDSATDLPVKAKFQEEGKEAEVSYYSYQPKIELGSLAGDFFAAEPPPVPQGSCLSSVRMGGWDFEPAAAVSPYSRFSSVVKTEEGNVLIVPEGAAGDGPTERATALPDGVELAAAPEDESPLEWQVSFAEDQTLSTEGSSVFVESGGERIAEIESVDGSLPQVDPGEPVEGEELSSGDRIVVAPGAAAVRVKPVKPPEEPPCFSTQAVAEALPEEEELEDTIAAHYAVTSGTASTAQVKVWVNPHPGVGNVKVTLQGPCNDHEKWTGSDGWVLFGGCSVGKSYTVSVPEWVNNPPNHYQLGSHIRQFTLSQSGHTIWFDYRLAWTDTPPAPPPPEPEDTGIMFQLSSKEPESGDASASNAVLPWPMRQILGESLLVKACAAAGYEPGLRGSQKVPTMRSTWFMTCRDKTKLTWVELYVTLQEATAAPKGHYGTWHDRDKLGNGKGVGEYTGLIKHPIGKGPMRLSSHCKDVDTIHAWRHSGSLWGFSVRFPNGVVLDGGTYKPIIEFCG